MLKVFLVEDECVVREGLRECIDWARYGFEFCGDAPDGELAGFCFGLPDLGAAAQALTRVGGIRGKLLALRARRAARRQARTRAMAPHRQRLPPMH